MTIPEDDGKQERKQKGAKVEGENTKKIMTMSFVGCALVVWLAAGILLDTAASAWGVVARVADQEIFRHGVPFLIAVITFVSLQFNKKVVAYMDEVITEIKKVVWPSRPETSAMTIVVCVMLLISGLLVGLFDMFSGYIVKYLINI